MSFRRPVQIVAAVLVLMLGGSALSACTGGEPRLGDYGKPADTEAKDYYDNFMFGCTNVEPDPAGATPTKATAAYTPPQDGYEGFDYCKCIYDGLEKKVPFADVTAFEDEQAKAKKNADGTYDITIPKNIQSVMAGCASKKS
jgi:hypothetical protein